MSDPTHPIPDEEFSGKNLDEIPAMLVCDGYSVNEWVPGRDGEGKPEVLCLYLHLGAEFDGAQIVLRVKSRPETNRLVRMLQRHRDGIWPLCRRCGAPEVDHGVGVTHHDFEASS